jgi:hypothetical protein
MSRESPMPEAILLAVLPTVTYGGLGAFFLGGAVLSLGVGLIRESVLTA